MNNTKTSSSKILEVKIVDQFGKDFKQLIVEYETPSAICGYVSPAVAIHLSQNLQVTEESQIESEAFENQLSILQKSSTIIGGVEKAMKYIQQDRDNYLKNYDKEFKKQSEKTHYKRDWVANYEIGDFIKANQLQDVIFIRQPEPRPNTLKHEEFRRYLLEKDFYRFGFYFERFKSENQNQFFSPLQWIEFQLLGEKLLNKTYVIDLQGHFCALRFLKIKKKKSSELQPTVVLFNSLINSNYSNRPILKKLAKMAFENIFAY
ncbi:hypothetical protein M0812_06768 [Anaeramoeba flamelloides]|uniref:Uncharacterized protein n=1 Tax=Anaeramoeba flamelloides TaxID=1746091 RepID=A0AAV8A8L8_9EUKA|nr:hypothetical protein M0812_06768 [Anaeramoeba flamelloides]